MAARYDAPDAGGSQLLVGAPTTAAAAAAGAGGAVAPFVTALASILDDARHAAVIHWSADGATVVIEDEDALVASVLPLYFHHSQVNSFYRQLSFYGFRRTRDEAPDDELGTHLLAQLEAARAAGGGRRRGGQIEYRHRDFLRGRPELLPKVVRKTNKESVIVRRMVRPRATLRATLLSRAMVGQPVTRLRSRPNCNPPPSPRTCRRRSKPWCSSASSRRRRARRHRSAARRRPPRRHRGRRRR